MSIDPVDNSAVNETANSLHGFDQDIAEQARFDDQSYSGNVIEEAADYDLTSGASEQLDFAQTGTNWDQHKNVLASYYDGLGSIVNGIY